MALVYHKRIKKGRGDIGFSVDSCKVWNSPEVPERYHRKHGPPKKEDPERMSMRALREALCEYAGKKGTNCAKCALCGYGRAWTRRNADDTQCERRGGDGMAQPARVDS